MDLLEAAEEGEVDKVIRLLKQGQDVNQEDIEGRSAVHWAAAGNHSEVLEALVQHRPNRAKLNGRDGCGMAPLHYTVDGEDAHLDAMQVLLDAKADPNVRDSDQYTPLLISVEKGHSHLLAVDLLLAYKADINQQTATDKRTPIHIAAEQGDWEVANCLMRYNPRLTIRDSEGKVAMELAMTDEVALLLEGSLEEGGAAPVKSSVRKLIPARQPQKANGRASEAKAIGGKAPLGKTASGKAPEPQRPRPILSVASTRENMANLKARFLERKLARAEGRKPKEISAGGSADQGAAASVAKVGSSTAKRKSNLIKIAHPLPAWDPKAARTAKIPKKAPASDVHAKPPPVVPVTRVPSSQAKGPVSSRSPPLTATVPRRAPPHSASAPLRAPYTATYKVNTPDKPKSNGAKSDANVKNSSSSGNSSSSSRSSIKSKDILDSKNSDSSKSRTGSSKSSGSSGSKISDSKNGDGDRNRDKPKTKKEQKESYEDVELRAWKREQQQAKEAIAKERETKDKEGRARAEATKSKLDGFLVGLLGGPKK